MRRYRFRVYFPQMLFVSYSILVVVYVSAALLADAVGDTTYIDLLVLFAITLCICIFNTFVSRGRFMHLLRFAGDLAILLGIGYVYDGFIFATVLDTLIAAAILGAVYLATWLFFYLSAVIDAGQVNRSLRKRRSRMRKQ